MENGYDTPYILNRFWKGNTVPDFYLLAKDEIERRGHISFNCDEENVNVYQPILAYIFKASRVSVRNMDTKEDIEIDGLPYLKTFIQGYKEGINYFEQDFKALYSPFDTDKLVAAIKSNYFDTRLEKEGKIGWEKVKKFVPANLNHKTIKEEGYFSGIVSRVEEIVSTHPQLFQDFYNTQKKKDSGYFLTTFENYEVQTSEDFARVKDNIDTNGHFIVDGVKVYSTELAFIFCSNALPARNLDTQKETSIKGYGYIKSYVEGYNEGIKYFDSKYSKEDERDIHINYFHSGYKGNQGWNIIRTGTINPPIITNESIKEMGYYAGIVNRVELIQKEYPKSFEDFDKCGHNLPPQKIETKTDKLKVELSNYGFFELPKVKKLSEPNKQSLIELISTNGLPYSIAMFDFLGFLKHIETQHFETKDKRNKEVAKWFNSDKEGRSVKGNISSLSENSNEDKSKYTAHTHKETVITDYQKLK